MKAKHMPLLIAIVAAVVAVWYFVTRSKNGRAITKAKNAAPGSSPTVQPSTTTPSTWRKATPMLQQNWHKEHIDTAKTNVEYKEQNGVLYVRGSIYTKNYDGAGPNGILAGTTPLTYGFNTSQSQKFAPYFRAEETDGNMMYGCVEFPKIITFDATSANRSTPLIYANLQVVNAGEMSYFGQSISTGHFALDFVHHSDDDGCATFTFRKS